MPEMTETHARIYFAFCFLVVFLDLCCICTWIVRLSAGCPN